MFPSYVPEATTTALHVTGKQLLAVTRNDGPTSRTMKAVRLEISVLA